MSRLWRRLYAETREWAVAANEAWMALLSPPEDGRPPRSLEANVVLFGPTQVGKTTLLLTLLGVDEGDGFADVQRVLRGGQEQGRSATATPTRYARSRDDLWRIDRADSAGLSPEAMQAKLAAVRCKVEAGSWEAVQPLEVFIPAYHFAQAEPPVRVAVLDLPGTAAANPRERMLVERVARHHLPAASLILLVSTANRLGVFEPEKLGQELEELRGWMRSPLRYRLVITFAFMQASLTHWRAKRDEQSCGLEDLRAFYVGEIEHFELGAIPDDLPRRLYPLELGDSWADLARERPDVHAWADGVQQEARRELIADIARSCEGERRLRISQEVAEQAYWRLDELKRQAGEKYRAWQAARTDLRRQSKHARAQRQRWAKRAVKYGERMHRLEAVGRKLDQVVRARIDEVPVAQQMVPQSAGAVPELLDGDDPPAPIQPTVSALKAWLRADRSRLVEACDRITGCFSKASGLKVAAFEPARTEAMGELRKRLDQYILEDYWPRLSNGFKDDRTLALEAAKAEREAITVALPKQLRRHLDKARRDLEVRRRIAVDRGTAWEARLRKLDGNASQIRANIRDDLTRYRRRLALIRHDLDHVAKFEAHMTEAYRQKGREIAAQVHQAVKAGQPAMALAKLLQLRLTQDEHHHYRRHAA